MSLYKVYVYLNRFSTYLLSMNDIANLTHLVGQVREMIREQNEVLRDIVNTVYEIKGYLGFQDAAEPKINDSFEWQGSLRATAQTAGSISPEPPTQGTTINRLVNGMEDITITGTISKVSPTHDFKYKNTGKPGKVKNVWLEDHTGKIKVCGFNEQAVLLEKVRVGDKVLITAWKVEFDKQKTPELQLLLGKNSAIIEKGQVTLQ